MTTATVSALKPRHAGLFAPELVTLKQTKEGVVGTMTCYGSGRPVLWTVRGAVGQSGGRESQAKKVSGISRRPTFGGRGSGGEKSVIFFVTAICERLRKR